MPLNKESVASTEADESLTKGVDLNKQLVKNSAATFFMRVSCESMIGAGIGNGDIIIVDQSIKPINGKIVIANINGEILIRRYLKTKNCLSLIPETTLLSSINLSAVDECKILGVVTYAIKKL